MSGNPPTMKKMKVLIENNYLTNGFNDHFNDIDYFSTFQLESISLLKRSYIPNNVGINLVPIIVKIS